MCSSWKTSGHYYFGSECMGNTNLLDHLVSLLSMNNQYGEDQDEATVIGFEVPRSPDSSYNNAYPGNEDDARDPPVVPPHLHHSLLSYPTSMNTSGNLPLPENVILNHLYIENREAPRSVVALGFTHRFRSKYVTVVLYKPVPRRGSSHT
ncbi:hypothetical protein CXB51_009144 [Gossypium anomalum]|uniref:Association with the SNF1 complex (ASC) domain-containing protein n=9 Tax=Gossypium TaxID=3633 RepID=A0A8J5Z904_9ROSI|nr:hypothetical protein CXB51_009144 [Gossypium anomalum]